MENSEIKRLAWKAYDKKKDKELKRRLFIKDYRLSVLPDYLKEKKSELKVYQRYSFLIIKDIKVEPFYFNTIALTSRQAIAHIKEFFDMELNKFHLIKPIKVSEKGFYNDFCINKKKEFEKARKNLSLTEQERLRKRAEKDNETTSFFQLVSTLTM